MIKKLIAFAAAAALSACVTTSDSFDAQNEIGTVYSGSIPTKGGDILLPPGDWTVVGKSTEKNKYSQTFGNVALAKIDENKTLDGFVMYSAALDVPMRFYFHASSYCDPEQQTLYFEQQANQQGGLQQCFFIEDWSLNVTENSEDFIQQADAYFKKHNVSKPATMLFTNYRMSRRNKLLIAQYGFNYRQPVGDVIPGFTPSEKFVYDHPFGTEGWKTNLETVVSWSKENEPKITKAFLK
ncbi:hypothetical protein [Thalassospira lucentensis]|uniref:hypothetical protein n=1 Tax=Thalassospira lucentensis TaxID=168935 RepID=UPI00142E5DDD|nr:hypothetical protein [Thalassospira lucentensis]NIZ01337.1 hypothetical protein [Thalassospira lucentensis]